MEEPRIREQTVSSSYFIMLNSNSPIADLSPEAVEKRELFEHAIRRIFASNNILNMIRINDPSVQGIPKERLISEINIRLNGEIAPQQLTLHYHGIVNIYHRTNLTLSNVRVMRWVAREYGISIFMSPPRIVSDLSIAMRRYSEKGQRINPPLFISSRILDIDGNAQHYNYQFPRA